MTVIAGFAAILTTVAFIGGTTPKSGASTGTIPLKAASKVLSDNL
ncbi:MAG TPA: hypothetical protein VMG30_16435 [Acidobacteriota bacterium]|nr:hypothetical protein [Acidobacteriota bacterium]